MRRIAIFQLPFRGRDEFLPLSGNPSLDARWVTPNQFRQVFSGGADVIVLPGSAATVRDLDYLRESGGARIIFEHLSAGGTVVGICGGYQILGNAIFDPLKRQGSRAAVEGLKLLPLNTLFGGTLASTTSRATCLLADRNAPQVTAVEHRSGYSWATATARDFHNLHTLEERIALKPLPQPDSTLVPGITWEPCRESLDGFVSADRRLWGTYFHLIFHNDTFNRVFFASLP